MLRCLDQLRKMYSKLSESYVNDLLNFLVHNYVAKRK